MSRVLALDVGDVRIGAAVERPLRLKSAEDLLRGKSLDIPLMRQAGEAAAEEADVVADIHGSAAYKKQLVRIHVARARDLPARHERR